MTSILEYCVRIVRPKFNSNPKNRFKRIPAASHLSRKMTCTIMN